MFWYTLHYFMNERQVKYGKYYLEQDTLKVFTGPGFSIFYNKKAATIIRFFSDTTLLRPFKPPIN